MPDLPANYTIYINNYIIVSCQTERLRSPTLKVQYWGSKKSRILWWFQIFWLGLLNLPLNNVPKKVLRENFLKSAKTEIIQNMHSFLPPTCFNWTLFWVHFNEFRIILKFRVSNTPYYCWWNLLAVSVNFKILFAQKDTFSDISQKVKTYCCANIYHCPLESY